MGTLTRPAVLRLWLATLLAVALPPGLVAQEVPFEPAPASECCLTLLVPVGARSTAMGGTNVAMRGTDAAFLNPAGLAGLQGSTFVVHHSDVGSAVEQIDAFSLVLTPFSVSVGVSYQLFDNGEITTKDNFNQPTGELAFRDHLVVASLATVLGAGVSIGGSYKLFQQRVDCTGQCGSAESVSTTSAVDVGLRVVPSWHPALSFGMAVVNAGPGLQVVEGEARDRFPGRLHLGVSYDLLAAVPATDMLALRVSGALRDELRHPTSPTVAVGLELDVQDAVFLRAGYAPGEGLGTGASVGVELRYDRFDIALSRSFLNSQLEGDTEPFQISFALNF